MIKHTRQSGVTLLELFITIAVLGVLLGLAVPYMEDVLEKARLKNAAEDALGALNFAKSEAVAQSKEVYVNFDKVDADTWCFGIDDTAAGCDCYDPSAANACQVTLAGVPMLKQTVNDTGNDKVLFPGIDLSGDYEAKFDWIRGTVETLGNVQFSSKSGFVLQVEVNVLGRTRICSPSGATTKVVGYRDC